RAGARELCRGRGRVAVCARIGEKIHAVARSAPADAEPGIHLVPEPALAGLVTVEVIGEAVHVEPELGARAGGANKQRGGERGAHQRTSWLISMMGISTASTMPSTITPIATMSRGSSTVERASARRSASRERLAAARSRS